MQAVILAGGLATRLEGLARDVPKSLLPVAGRPFIEWQFERLRESGFRRVLLCIGHLGQPLRDHIGDGAQFGLNVAYSEDGPRLLGTAGALRRALPRLEGTFLVTYGDSYLPFDYRAPLVDLDSRADALGTLAVFHNAGQIEPSNTRVRGEWVLQYDKSAQAAELDHIDYGAMALRREVIAALPLDEPYGLDQVQTQLAAARQLRAVTAEQRFYEIGSPRGLAELETHLTP